MKHALVLFSSPHKDGHTKKLLEAFLDGLKGEDWQVKSLDIFKVNIHPCIACGYCQKADGCAFRDLDKFDRDLRVCELLVIATPVYNLSFPAQLKAVIDRFQRYFEARFARGIRPAIATHRESVCGGGMRENAAPKLFRYEHNAQKNSGFAGHRPCRLRKLCDFREGTGNCY